jgi:hypothetical protein
LRTTVSASNDVNPGNNEVILDFNVQAASDLYPRATVHSPNLRPGATTLITAHVFNDGAFDTDAMLTIRTSQLNSVSTRENCVVVSFRWLECQLGNVSAGSSVNRDFEFTVSSDPLAPAGDTSQAVELILSPTLPDSKPGNNTFSQSVKIWGSFIDLTVETISAPTSMLIGESGEVVLEFINNGPDTAPDGHLRFSFYPQLFAESVSTSRGRCDLVTSGGLCYWDDVLAGERIEVRFKFQTIGVGLQFLTAETRHASAFDTDNNNNGVNAEILSESPPNTAPPSGTRPSGGGGAVTFLVPLLLMQLLARRVQRRRARRCNLLAFKAQ